MTAKTLLEFLRSQMDQRHMSAREFAHFLGVSHTTINRLIADDGDPTTAPSVEFLRKLAYATNTDICYLMLLIDPQLPNALPISADALDLSRRIAQLPAETRQVIDQLLIGLARQNAAAISEPTKKT
ncbi:MAG: helix-turn-helix transcriptional regulator [Anaerolineae bacterium]|nr:helix-turn-helix transcriptional regulator [Anaerolineae bacterium]